MSTPLPLEGLLVLEFAQFLSGPLCGLRLADLGARVIKIERAGSGDLGRQLYLSDTSPGGVNTHFQAINRNKQSFAADLKNPADQARIFALIERADVLIQNFRPGVFDRLGFTHEVVARHNPRIVYASITGYGTAGPWVDFPGQDLLAQARSGVMWLNGLSHGGPIPLGLSVADMLAGHNLTEGILAALVRRGITGKGGTVSTSLLESLLDFQFEVLTTHLNDGRRTPQRAERYGAHAYLPAPYGVYATADGHIAIAMTPVNRLMELLEMPGAADFEDRSVGFSRRQEILDLLGARLIQRATQQWLDILQPHDIWCADVHDWSRLLESDGLSSLDMIQELQVGGMSVKALRIPICIDGARMKSPKSAPGVGEHTRQILDEFGI
jgi:CoA:oxalate CoA-transferase